MKFFKSEGTKVFAISGLGEVGRNMYCIMHGDELIITDAGVTFPGNELMGVDYIIPDFTFLKQNEKKIKEEEAKIIEKYRLKEEKELEKLKAKLEKLKLKEEKKNTDDTNN